MRAEAMRFQAAKNSSRPQSARVNSVSAGPKARPNTEQKESPRSPKVSRPRWCRQAGLDADLLSSPLGAGRRKTWLISKRRNALGERRQRSI